MRKPMRLLLTLFLGLALPSLMWADSVTLGGLYFNSTSGSDQLSGFTVGDWTGPVWGCESAFGTPVCDAVNFINTSLTVTFQDGTTAVASPAYTFTPGTYLYGEQAGDDPSQSFLFDIPALNDGPIVDAVFNGSFSQASFSLDDGSTFDSTGVFSADLDIADGFNEADIDATSVPVGGPVPEPATGWLLATGVIGLGWVWRRQVALAPEC